MSMKRFKLSWGVKYPMKGFEKGYSMITFLKTLTETITVKNVKHGMSMENIQQHMT